MANTKINKFMKVPVYSIYTTGQATNFQALVWESKEGYGIAVVRESNTFYCVVAQWEGALMKADLLDYNLRTVLKGGGVLDFLETAGVAVLMTFGFDETMNDEVLDYITSHGISEEEFESFDKVVAEVDSAYGADVI